MTRHRTQDRAAQGTGPPRGVGGMHTTEQIGPKRHRTPEGYLLCEDVCVARTGWMIYGPGETPIKTNDHGFAMVERDDKTLFNPVTMMSFSGKPVTNDHPMGGVTPHNWSRVSVGSVLNVRRGTGDDADTMRADLLITDAKAILDVDAGKREVSAGYEADYQTTGDGEGRQIHIIGNHIALVRKGRCGPRCAIGDKAPTLTSSKGKKTMPQRNIPRITSEAQRAQIITALGLDAGPGDDEDEDGETDAGHVHVHLHNGPSGKTADADPTADAATADARFTAIEDSIAGLVKVVGKLVKGKTADANELDDNEEGGDDDSDEDDDKGKGKTADSKALETGFKSLVADAEVLVPGFKVPTFDGTADRKKTVDSMCAIRRKVLDTVNVTAEGALMLATVSGKPVDTMTMDCAAVASLFKSAAGAKKLMNNGSATAGAGSVGLTADAVARAAHLALPVEKRGPKSVSELNEMNRKLFPLGTV